MGEVMPGMTKVQKAIRKVTTKRDEHIRLLQEEIRKMKCEAMDYVKTIENLRMREKALLSFIVLNHND